MKKLFKLLLVSLLVGSTGIVFADELIVGDGHHDDHARVVVVAPVHHHRRHYHHPKPHAVVVINAGDRH